MTQTRDLFVEKDVDSNELSKQNPRSMMSIHNPFLSKCRWRTRAVRDEFLEAPTGLALFSLTFRKNTVIFGIIMTLKGTPEPQKESRQSLDVVR